MIELPQNPTPKDLAAALMAANKQIDENTEAIKAILTLLHPNEHHPAPEDPHLESFHDLVMKWIQKYGRMEV